MNLLEPLFPSLCELCGTKTTSPRNLCDPCKAALPRLAPPFCKTCGEPFPGNITGPFDCPNCTGLKFAFAFARAPVLATGPARELVHGLKYQKKFFLAHDLAELIAELFETEPRLANLPPGLPLVPVPLHPSREQTRWGNQAAELARSLAKLTPHLYLPALRRIRATQTQTRLTRAQRLKNLKSAFALHPRHAGKIQEKTVLLLDDVFTTGSTAQACASVLLKQGHAQQVIVLTALRG